MAVMAALNIRVAKCVSLGVSIGNKLKVKVLEQIGEPIKAALSEVHPDLAQWVEPTVDSLTNVAGISITLAPIRKAHFL